MKSATIIVATLLSFGCTRDISSFPPYSKYVGRTVILKTPIDVWKPRSGAFVEPHYLGLDDQFGGAARVVKLPAGTPLRIDRVVYFDGVDAQYILATGEVRIAGQPPLRFEYHWNYYAHLVNGPDCRDCIGRAPWEGPEVPLMRRVGTDGRDYMKY